MSLAVVVVGFIGLVGRFAESSSFAGVKHGSVLKISLDGEIEETDKPGEPDYTSLIQGTIDRPQALDVIVQSIREGAANKDISALYIECGEVAASPATLNAIRQAVLEFKKEGGGKKVYAYGDNISMGAYYVASAADRIYLNPGGHLSINGLSSTSLYMKGLFDKLGIDFQVVKVGTFKSAVEPYIMDTMSEPARAQLDTLFGGMWSFMRKEIASTRKKVTPAMIDSLVSVRNITFSPATVAMETGLVDSLIYGREIDSRFAPLCGKEPDDINYVSPSQLMSLNSWVESHSSKNQIAVLYACGEIVDGSPSGINYETLVPEIVKLAEDDNVKGMVLRVNSPGGSAFGSEQIGEALDYFQKQGKPLAVSMGDYAASGGYWISACADRIFADPLTVTGSIGIFGLIPNVSGLSAKLGISPQTVSTNPAANFPTLLTPMDERQLGVMQKYVEHGYEQFTTRVARGRKMKLERVLTIAEGRVWGAVKAKEIGLVDQLGGLDEAVKWTAAKAKIADKYNLTVYPQYEPSLWDMVMQSNTQMKEVIDNASADPQKAMVELARRILSRQRIQARMRPLIIRL